MANFNVKMAQKQMAFPIGNQSIGLEEKYTPEAAALRAGLRRCEKRASF
eukprot:COSAG06_NODE_66_length_26393_cov_6.455161_27_plen_49_part_00